MEMEGTLSSDGGVCLPWKLVKNLAISNCHTAIWDCMMVTEEGIARRMEDDHTRSRTQRRPRDGVRRSERIGKGASYGNYRISTSCIGKRCVLLHPKWSMDTWEIPMG